MQVSASIEIERPIEVVWEFVADPRNDPVWCPKVEAVEPNGAGCWCFTHRPVPLRPAIALMVEQVAVQRPARLQLREEDASSVFVVDYRLEDLGRVTRFTQTSEFTWKSLPEIVQRLLALGVARDVRRQLRGLKRALER